MNSSSCEAGGQIWRSRGLITFATILRRKQKPPLPVSTFNPGNAFRFNNYLAVDVGDGMGTGDKIK